MLKRIYLLITAVMLLGQFVDAQVTTGTLSGIVKDAAGQPLAGATVIAMHQPTGTRYSTATTNSGQFTISGMQVGGPYTIQVTYVGHEPQRFDDINLRLSETFVLPVTMEKTAAAMEQVVVSTTGRSSVLNANRTGAVTNITSREIQRMPSITRSLNDLTRMTPQSNGPAIGGGNYRQNYITVDGSDFNNTFGIGSNLPAGGSPISLDALEEISINVSPFDIRQSGFIGSAVNAVTRSGNNTFSGSVYQYWRSEKQQGDEVAGEKFERNPFEFKQQGVRLGGPIIKNKLFFFGNYEKENQPKQIQTRVAATPSQPFTGTGNVSRPTAAELDMISAYLQSKYGYETGPYQGYSTEIEREKIMGRIDWNVNQNHRLSIRYNQVEGGEPNPPSTSRSPLTGYASSAGRTSINALWFKNSHYFQGANFYSLAAELISRFGNVTNVFRPTYTFQNDSRSSPSAVFPFVDILKDGTPFTSFGYEPFTFGNLRKVKTYSLVNNTSWRSNKHSFTVGGQFDLSTTINGFQRFATSYYTFNSWDDFVNGAKPRDFGITYSLAPGYQQAFPSFKFAQLSLYGQDEISLTDKFRLTLGLRLDRPWYPDVSEIKTHPLVAALTFANGEKINTGTLPEPSIMWSPRAGFNWDVNGDRSFQIRGGTGIFNGRVPFVWIVSQSGDAGLLQVTQTFAGQANTPGPFNPNPAAYLPATQPAAGTVIPSTISALDPDFKFPQTWKSTLALDKRLPWGLVVSWENILNKDINTAVFRNPNLVAPQPLNVSGYPDNRLVYPVSNNQKFINPLTSSGQASPTGTGAFNTIVLDNGDKGYYFSSTIKIDKQFSRGWFATIAYTKSIAENLFDGSGDQPLSAWQGTDNVDGANFPVLSSAGFVMPDRLIGAVSYRKEYLKHLGTTISLFYEGSQQGRFSYTYTADLNRDGSNNDLIYIPKDPSEITFVPKTLNGVTYSAQQQSDLFFKYIQQDEYLREHQGQYAERNGALYPWRNQFDIKVLQDVFVNIGKNRNTLQFSLDIFNFGNLLNSKWGILKTVNASSLLVPTNATGTGAFTAGGTTKPTFQLATVGNQLATETFRNVVSISSTYYMQFGVRYLFN